MKANLKAVVKYTGGFRLPMLISFVLLGVELIFFFISPLFMSVTIDSVLDNKPLNTPWYFTWFIKAVGGVEAIRESLWIIAGSMLGVAVIMGVIRFIRAKCNNQAGEGVVKRLRDRLYAHIQRLPFKYHAASQTGDVIQRATNDVETVRRFVMNTMLEFIRTVLMLLVGLVVMAGLNITLTVITVIMVIPVAAASALFFRRISRLSTIQEESEGKLFTVIQENLTGTRVVRAFGRQRFELERFDERNEDNRRKMTKVNMTFAHLWTTLDMLCGVEIALILIVSVILCARGTLSIGEFTAFSSYVFLFFWPIRGFGRVLNDTSRTLVAVGRIEEIFAEKEEEGLDEGVSPPLCGDIVFDNVCFSYDSAPVLNGLSMTIPGGKTVAFLGGTGSGKSTIALLLQRLYDHNDGSITIGGTDITTIKKRYLRNKIGIVLQEPFLYSKSILQNIGIKCREPDLQQVREAAAAAFVHEDIMDFEDGYDTIVGERGVTLSGGQKQRVAIARALTGDNDMLIFDDSLSAVDTKTDAAIRDALAAKRHGVTTIIISHRITTLMEADRIFVLKDGKIAEEGTHSELMAKGGIYRRTHDIQNAVDADGGDN